jgi:hypothetical protein
MGGAFTIGPNNFIGGGNLDIMNNARLIIKASDIRNINYHLADSSILDINGAAAKQLLKINQP